MEGLGTVASALLTLGLVAVAVALSLYGRLGLEKDIGIVAVRSFVQLAAIGYVINFIFGLDSLGYVALLLVVMVGFAGWTSSRRELHIADRRDLEARELRPGRFAFAISTSLAA